MGGIDPMRLAWALQRGFLRHGILFLLALVLVACTLLMAGATVLGWWRLQALERELAAHRAAPAKIAPVVVEQVRTLPVPGLEQRFEMNRQVLSGLHGAGLEPAQIRFQVEEIREAGLARQTVSFKHAAGWGDIAQALENLQATDVPLYIAKVRLQRESPADPRLEAEIQVAGTFTMPAPSAAGVP